MIEERALEHVLVLELQARTSVNRAGLEAEERGVWLESQRLAQRREALQHEIEVFARHAHSSESVASATLELRRR